MPERKDLTMERYASSSAESGSRKGEYSERQEAASPFLDAELFAGEGRGEPERPASPIWAELENPILGAQAAGGQELEFERAPSLPAGEEFVVGAGEMDFAELMTGAEPMVTGELILDAELAEAGEELESVGYQEWETKLDETDSEEEIDQEFKARKGFDPYAAEAGRGFAQEERYDAYGEEIDQDFAEETGFQSRLHGEAEGPESETVSGRPQPSRGLSPAVQEALRKKQWRRALKMALREGGVDEQKLAILRAAGREAAQGRGQIQGREGKKFREWIELSEWVFGVPATPAESPGEFEKEDLETLLVEAADALGEEESGGIEFEAQERLTGQDFDREEEGFAQTLVAGEGEMFEYDLSEAALEHEVIAPDTRAIVKEPLGVPYRWICALDLYFENPDYGPNRPKWIARKGTGVLIDGGFVLTAAHVLHDSVEGSQGTTKRLMAGKVVVTPARYGPDARLGSVEGEKWLTNQNWNPQSPSWNQDYGLIKLKEAIGLKRYPALDNQPLGCWGSQKWGGNTVLQPLDRSILQDHPVWVAGYAGDKCGQKPQKGSLSKADIERCAQRTPELWASYPWIGSGQLAWISPQGNLMHHTVDTFSGQSGAPVWLRYQDRRWLVGLHVAPASPAANFAVRVTQAFLDEIARLKTVL